MTPGLGVDARPPTLRALLSLAWPVIVSRSSQSVVGLADAIMVAALGEAALAATTTGALNFFNFIILPMGVVFIVQSFTAQLTGKQDDEGARRYGWYGLVIAAVCGALVVPALPFIDELLRLFAYEPDVTARMTSYLQIRALSLGAALGVEALGAYFGGLGNTRLPMAFNLVAMGVNVFLNWVLIFGNLGAPALGVDGAALASVLATSVAFLGLFACFFLGKGGGARRATALRAHEVLRVLRFGLPSGLNWFFEFLAFSFFINVVVAGLGTTALAAVMLVFQLNSVAFMPAFGVATAGAILVGQAIGADRKDRVPRATLLAMGTSGGWQLLVGLVYLSAPVTLLALIADPSAVSPELLEMGARILMLSVAWQLSDAAAITLSEVLRAAGDTAFPLWARTIIAWGLFAPGSYATVHVFGGTDVAAVLWIVFYLSALAGVLWWRFSSGAWRSIELVERELPST